MADGKVHPQLRDDVLEEGDFKCKYCGLQGYIKGRSWGTYTTETAFKGVWMSIDHIVPWSRGGESVKSNLQVLCTSCNSMKGQRLESELLAEFVKKMKAGK